MSKSIFHYIGIIALGLYAVQHLGSALAARFNIGRVKMNIGSLNSTGLSFSIDVPITNSSPISVPIDSMSGIVRFGQYALADVFINNPVTIIAGDTQIYKVSGQVEFVRLADNIATIFSNGDYRNNLFLDLVVRSVGGVFRSTHQINVI